MGVIDAFYYRGAGTSAMHRYKDLSRRWRQRTFGRRTGYYVAAMLLTGSIACFIYTPASWRFGEGLLIGGIGAMALLLPEALMLDSISSWERGAWGEQGTARALRRLGRLGWLVRHDLATGFGDTNRDHIAVGPAVYLLDTKVRRDVVTVEPDGLHVRQHESNSDHTLDCTKAMLGATRALKLDLERCIGFPVAVYPVVVIWSHFPAGEYWDGDVAYVAGERLAQWLADRPVDLLREEKREAVKAWLRSLPAAGE